MTTNAPLSDDFTVGATARRLRELEDENRELEDENTALRADGEAIALKLDRALARVTELESHLSAIESLERVNEDAAAARISALERERDELQAMYQRLWEERCSFLAALNEMRARVRELDGTSLAVHPRNAPRVDI